MADNMEVIISAIDEASEIFSSIASSCGEMMSSITGSATEASEGIDDIGIAAEEIGSSISEIDSTTIDDVSSAADEASSSADELSSSLENVDGSTLGDAASGADELGDSLSGAASAADQLSNSMSLIEGSMLLGAAEQIGSLAGNTEDMAQQMNSASIAVGQLATQTGIAEPEMVSLINNISNATFPNDEAMMYVKNLSQMGVESSNFAKSATDIDIINDAFGMGAQATNSMATEMSVLGVNMNDVSSSFNALAYANANTKGGMDNFFAFLRKYDADLHDMGYDIDQTAVIIAGATQKFGGGKAALSGLSNALKEADGDSRKLEEALGLQAGSLDNATALTGEYAGVTEQLASEEAEHKTILDQIGAAWEDVSLSLSGVLSPAASAISAIGEVGSLGMSIKGIKELGTTFNSLKETKMGMTVANYAQAASETVLSTATAAYGTVVGVLTGEIGLAEAATMAWNAVLAMNPLVLVAVAAVALAVAVYEVGKAFGWWNDVSSMLDAIWSGIQRLWDAFVNHPDVQAVFSVLTGAWDALVGAISPVIDAITSFFSISTGGDFDVVRALIDGIGAAWNAMTLPIRMIIDLFSSIISIGTSMLSGQTDIVTGIMQLWVTLQAWWTLILGNIINSIVSWGSEIVRNATKAASDFVKNIVNYIKLLPGRFLNYLTRTGRNIITQVNKWVTNARNGAKNLINGVINFVKQLPGKVKDQMLKVATSITTGASKWASNARRNAQGIVSGVTGAISGLPGQVYNKMIEIGTNLTRAGSDLYNKAKNVGQQIWNGLKSALGGGGAAGFEMGPAAAGFDMNTGEDFNIYTGQTYEVKDTTDININETMDVVFDFKNVPEGTSEERLLQMLEKFITDKAVIKRLVEDPTFQNLDAKVKEKILSKAKRANGA